MSDIRNITLAFPCQEKLEHNAAGEFYCHKCAHAITDFRCQSAEALQEAMRQAGTKPVCGIFKRSQLSEKFATYAAATTIAVTGIAATMCSPDHDKALPKIEVTPENESFAPVIGEIVPDVLEVDTIEFVTAGIVADPSLFDTTALRDHPGFQEER